jgi:hypothetical protein
MGIILSRRRYMSGRIEDYLASRRQGRDVARLNVSHDGTGTYLELNSDANQDIKLGEVSLIEDIGDSVRLFNELNAVGLGKEYILASWPKPLIDAANKLL